MKLRVLTLLAAIILTTHTADAKKFLIFGAHGWIGQKVVALLKQQNHVAIAARARLENRWAIINDLEEYQPDFVINAAGVTGRPNVDWCEDHRYETIRSNIIGALNLVDICFERTIHCTHFGTGCIYEYDEQHQMGNTAGFTEEDRPNFTGSFYSKTKTVLDDLLRCYPNVLHLRLRMPIDDTLNERNFITKISRYKKVINVPNSMTVLPELLPVALEMTLNRYTGVYNLVNPGAISHNEILDLYKHYIDPTFTYENFSVEEQNTVLKSKRSNNQLDASKLLQEFPNIKSIREAIISVFETMQQNGVKQ